MLVVPTQPLPNQTLTVNLDGQICQINLYQRYGLYMDLLVSDLPIVVGVVCENLNRVVRDAYLGFVGDLCFADQQGTTDPVYAGLGSRYLLMYLEEADL